MRVGYDYRSLININLRLSVGENLLITNGRSDVLLKLFPIFLQRMNLPSLPINEKLQKLFETDFLLHFTAQIIDVHSRAKFLVVLIKHLDKIILELITTWGIFGKCFGFSPSLFSISRRIILISIANEVLSLGSLEKARFDDQLRDLREGTHILAPGLSVHIEEHQIDLIETFFVNAREIVQQTLDGFFIAKRKTEYVLHGLLLRYLKAFYISIRRWWWSLLLLFQKFRDSF
jgi:hypothetical protein